MLLPQQPMSAPLWIRTPKYILVHWNFIFPPLAVTLFQDLRRDKSPLSPPTSVTWAASALKEDIHNPALVFVSRQLGNCIPTWQTLACASEDTLWALLLANLPWRGASRTSCHPSAPPASPQCLPLPPAKILRSYGRAPGKGKTSHVHDASVTIYPTLAVCWSFCSATRNHLGTAWPNVSF